MKLLAKKCFVCEAPVDSDVIRNEVTNLPVCEACRGTSAEKNAENDLLESLSERLVCGCVS